MDLRLTDSPTDVVEQFVKMDAEGGDLHPKVDTTPMPFSLPSEPIQPKVIVVIAKPYGISEAPDRGNKTQFLAGYAEVGRVNTSSPHFAPTNKGFMCQYDRYTLVETSKKQDNAPLEFRIDGLQPTIMHFTAKAAMRYVTQRRATTNDPTNQKNADQTLGKLTPFR